MLRDNRPWSPHSSPGTTTSLSLKRARSLSLHSPYLSFLRKFANWDGSRRRDARTSAAPPPAALSSGATAARGLMCCCNLSSYARLFASCR